MTQRVEWLLQMAGELVRKATHDNAAGYDPLEQTIIALLAGLLHSRLGHTKPFTTTLDVIHDFTTEELAEMGPHLGTTVRWIQQAPYHDSTSNCTFSVSSKQLDLQASEQRAARPDDDALTKLVSDATTRHAPRLFKHDDSWEDLQHFIAYVATDSFRTKTEIHGFDLQPGKTHLDYTANFLNGLFNCYKQLGILNERQLQEHDANIMQRKIQLVTLCWALAYTYTNERRPTITLRRHTLPACLECKAVVDNIDVRKDDFGRQTRSVHSTRQDYTFFSGVTAEFPQRVLTPLPVRDDAVMTVKRKNDTQLTHAIRAFDDCRPSKKSAVVARILLSLQTALDSNDPQERENCTKTAFSRLEQNRSMLSRHRLYSPLMYVCIAIGLALGLIGGIVIWAMADHKRELLKRIDRKHRPTTARAMSVAERSLAAIHFLTGRPGITAHAHREERRTSTGSQIELPATPKTPH
jgi:hypothetical protein